MISMISCLCFAAPLSQLISLSRPAQSAVNPPAKPPPYNQLLQHNYPAFTTPSSYINYQAVNFLFILIICYLIQFNITANIYLFIFHADMIVAVTPYEC
jgi:hypothetical protein